MDKNWKTTTSFFYYARKNERERKSSFEQKKKPEHLSSKKGTRTIKTHHHVSQFVRRSSDFWNSHAVKCTRDVENTR